LPSCATAGPEFRSRRAADVPEGLTCGYGDRMPRTDRIAEPWGTRTPYGPGETWPIRVDQYLADGLTEDDVERWVRSASILHSNGDALGIAARDGGIVGVRGRAVDRGRLAPKDLFGWQANASHGDAGGDGHGGDGCGGGPVAAPCGPPRAGVEPRDSSGRPCGRRGSTTGSPPPSWRPWTPRPTGCRILRRSTWRRSSPASRPAADLAAQPQVRPPIVRRDVLGSHRW